MPGRGAPLPSPREGDRTWLGVLTRELPQVRTEVALGEVAVPGGGAHDPERAGHLSVVGGVSGSAVVVDVDGEASLAGVLEHEIAVGVVEARTAGREERDRDGAVAVVDDLVVPTVGREDVGVRAAGPQVRGHAGAVDALPVVRER